MHLTERRSPLKSELLIGLAGAGTITLMIAIAQLEAKSPSVLVSAQEIARVLRGKTCTSRAGAKFTFGYNGRYVYEGLWKNAGRYTIGNGAIVVAFDNGLVRSFAISRKEGAYYIEETALSCG